jgi:hypothetical protein
MFRRWFSEMDANRERKQFAEAFARTVDESLVLAGLESKRRKWGPSLAWHTKQIKQQRTRGYRIE